MDNKKIALAFLSFVNVINIAAGIYTQLVLLFNWDFMALFPVMEMGTMQILYINLLAVVVVITLISVIVAALVNDGSYDAGDVFTSCPVIALLVPVVLFFISLYTAMGAASLAEKLIGIGISALYIFANYVNFGCMAVIKDMD